MTAYLDNSATTRLCDEAVQACLTAMRDQWQNPSAAYASSIAINKQMDACRALLLKKLGARGNVVFTSGGTEGDHMAVFGAMKRRGAKTAITTAVEHPAVLQNVANFDHQLLSVNERCEIDLDRFEELIKADQGIGLVSVMHVNNETGTVFPIDKLAELTHKYTGALFHSDGVQGFLHAAPPDFANIDLYSVSGHKIHALKGVGALYIANGVKLAPVIFGGGQENGLRSGTENTPGIYSLKAAMETDSYDADAVMALKLRLYNGIMDIYPNALVNGPEPRLAAAHILNISFPGIMAEVLLHALEGDGVFVSTGSACAARQSHPSHVLAAMGLPGDRIKSAIRFSLCGYTTAQEIDYTLEALKKHLPVLSRFKRR